MSPRNTALPLMASDCCCSAAWIRMHALCHIFGQAQLMVACCFSLSCWLKITDAWGCMSCYWSPAKSLWWKRKLTSPELSSEENPPSHTVQILLDSDVSCISRSYLLLVNPRCLYLPHLLYLVTSTSFQNDSWQPSENKQDLLLFSKGGRLDI